MIAAISNTMPKRAGEIVISIRGNSAKLKSDLSESKNAIRSWSHGTTSDIQGASGALRLMRGDLTNNIRTVERFMVTTLKLGPVLRAAFPVVGGLAFAGMIGDLTGKVVNFFREVEKGPANTRNAFANLNANIRVTNDGLAVTNARLANEIAALQGKPVNNLLVALAEVREEADKLGVSLQNDLEKSTKLMQEQSGGFLHNLGAGLMGKADINDLIDEQKKFAVSTQGLQGTPLQSAYSTEIAKYEEQLKQATYARDHDSAYGVAGFDEGVHVGDMSTRIEALKGTIQQYKQLLDEIKGTQQEGGQIITKAGLDNLKQAAELTKPLTDKLATLQAELEGARLKLAAVGDASAGALAQGMAKAGVDIAETNKKLEKMGPAAQMNALQALQIIFTDVETAAIEAETKWQQKFDETTKAIQDRTKAQQLLNAAIGGTYSQQRSAHVESNLMGALGTEHYNDSAWRQQHAGQVATLARQFGQEFDQDAAGKNKTELQQLADKITLTNALAMAEKNGADAVRQAELAEKIHVATRGMDAAAAAKLAEEMTKVDAAERLQASQKELKTLQEQATAMERLAAAYGHKAQLQAEAQNAYDKAINSGKGVDVAEAERQATLQKGGYDSLESAKKSLPSEQLDHLQQMEDALRQIAATQGMSLEIQNALKDIAKQRLEIEAQELEKTDSIMNGMRAALDKMAATAQTVSSIVSQAMDTMLNDTSKLLADMLTGQKPKHSTWGQQFGKMFQNLGHQLIQNTIKSGLQRLAGKVVHKPTGNAGDPVHVVVDSPTGSAPPTGNAVPNPLGGLAGRLGGVAGAAGGLFGTIAGMLGSAGGAPAAGGGLTADVSSTFTALPGMAGGGDVYSGGAAMIGENGPEVAQFPKGARVTPLDKMGGGDTHVTINNHIDASGAEIGVENRIQQMLEENRHAAITTAIRAVHEQKWRTPTKSGNK